MKGKYITLLFVSNVANSSWWAFGVFPQLNVLDSPFIMLPVLSSMATIVLIVVEVAKRWE
jgi:hypothetical protein